MSEPNFMLVIPLVAILGAATLLDSRHRRVPNALSLGGAVLGVAINVSLLGPAGFIFAASGWALCMACLMPFYLGRGMAAGDVKLMGAAGAFLGPVDGILACMLTLVSGGAIGLLTLAWLSLADHVSRWRSAAPAQAEAHGSGAVSLPSAAAIPYAGAIAIGTTIVALRPAMLAHLLPDGVWT